MVGKRKEKGGSGGWIGRRRGGSGEEKNTKGKMLMNVILVEVVLSLD